MVQELIKQFTVNGDWLPLQNPTHNTVRVQRVIGSTRAPVFRKTSSFLVQRFSSSVDVVLSMGARPDCCAAGSRGWRYEHLVFSTTGYEPNAINMTKNPDVVDLTQGDDDSVSEDRHQFRLPELVVLRAPSRGNTGQRFGRDCVTCVFASKRKYSAKFTARTLMGIWCTYAVWVSHGASKCIFARSEPTSATASARDL